jgi:hypothetical protein
LLAGCSTGLDPNYTAYLTAQQAASAARNTRLEALGKAAQNTSPEVAAAAVMAIALDGGGSSSAAIQAPAARNSNALGWASLILNTGLSAFGIHVNKQIAVGAQNTSVLLEQSRDNTFLGLGANGGGNTSNTFTFGDGSSGIVGDGNTTTVQRDTIDNSLHDNPVDNSLHDNPVDNSNQYNPISNYTCPASGVCP